MNPHRPDPSPDRIRSHDPVLRPPPRRLAALVAGLFSALLLLGAGGELAAQTGSIQGSVIDAQSGRALVGTQVSIPGTQRGVVAGAQGRYVLENVPAGEVTLRFQIIGYELVDRVVTVQAGTTVTLDMQLRTRALAMDELVVTGVG